MMDKVQGECPMGCGETLFLGENGYVTCSYATCSRPDQASVLLERAADINRFLIGFERLVFPIQRMESWK